jgi:hypothetical protein
LRGVRDVFSLSAEAAGCVPDGSWAGEVGEVDSRLSADEVVDLFSGRI